MVYRVFISHGHEEHFALYDSLVSRFNQQRFDWLDMSVPEQRRYGVDGPLPKHDLEQLLTEHITRADVLLVIAKPIVARKPWLRWELECAAALGKPIIALWRRQVDLRVSRIAVQKSWRQVDTWNILSIIRAIEEVVAEARNQQSSLPFSVPDPLTFNDEDVTIEPMVGNITDGLARIEELALTGNEKVHAGASAGAPKDVLGVPLVQPARENTVSVDQALGKLENLPSATAVVERPRDVVSAPSGSMGVASKPTNGLKWPWSADFG